MSLYLYARNNLRFHILPLNLHTLQQAGRGWLNLRKKLMTLPILLG